jgi:DNA-binding XRE family transcriptional regulator
MHQIITKIKTCNNLIIEATFADGEVVIFDVKTLFDKFPLFRDLEKKDLFEKVVIDGTGYGICWNDKLDLSSDGIYSKGKHVRKVDPEIRIIVGQNIAQAREDKHMSQRDLSKKSGVMQAEISKIELGKGNPTISTLQKIAKALGKSLKSLLI